MTDDDGAVGAEGTDHRGDIVADGQGVMPAGRLVGRAEPAEVESGDAVARIGQARDLLAPRPPELGETVEEDDERPSASDGEVEAGTVRCDESVLPAALDEGGRGVGDAQRLIASTVSCALRIAFSGTGLAFLSALMPTRARMPATAKSRSVTMR